MRRSSMLLGLGAFLAACAKSPETAPSRPVEMDAGGAHLDASGPWLDDGSGSRPSALEIRPSNPTLSVSGAPAKQALALVVAETGSPVSATWTTDSEAVAEIDPLSGVLTARGDVGGEVRVTATHDGRAATTVVTVDAALEDNAGNVAPGDVAKLRAGGLLANDPAFRWLYPYDGTVFPRGVRSPLLQLGGSADAVRVQVASKHMRYDAFFGASSPIQISLDAARWAAIAESAGGEDTVSTFVTKLSGGVAAGPLRETWTIAKASLRGTVYYATYATPQAGGTGALLKVRPGTAADAEVFVSTCTVCHVVSANGNVVVAGTGFRDGNPIESGTFGIGPGSAPVRRYSEPFGRFAFGGLTPDGAYMMSHATAPGGVRGLTGSTGSSLYATASGQRVAAPGWDGVVQNAQMPSFAPDGRRIVFNDRDTSSAGHALGTMQLDPTTLTFSARQVLLTDAAQLVAWPAFLPDSSAVVFHAGTDFGTENAHADIELVDVATKRRTRLPALNGFLGDGRDLGPTYLPYGESAEGHLDYEPTVLPVAVGGYFWVVFTSRRCYGNSITPATLPFAELSARKKLWVAAIDQTGAPDVDRSHPAFYLPGQDLATGNMRGFWALDPCKANGQDCASGDECCGGYCSKRGADGGSARACASSAQGCALELEKCASASDCCGASEGYRCVNARCAAPPPK